MKLFGETLVHRLLPILMVAATLAAACGVPAGNGTEMKTPSHKTIRQLPPPYKKSKVSLEETLARRRSMREFTDEALTEGELSQLLWATQGITHEDGYRTSPSAGALYPLELYVALPSGFYHYDPQQHVLASRLKDDVRLQLHKAALAQDAILAAPAVFVITAVHERTARKYGQRAGRYVDMEAGHAAQNLLLQATALGLGGVPIGAFEDDQISKVLSLPQNEAPLYLIPLGHPR